MTSKAPEEEFNLDLDVAGRVHCRRLTAGDLLDLELEEKTLSDSSAMARRALQLLATKLTDGTQLSPQELEAVTEKELELFCSRLVENNLLPERRKDLPDSVRQEGESGPDYFVRSWKSFFTLPSDSFSDLFKNLHQPALSPFFTTETIKNISETARRSAHLGSVIDKIRLPLEALATKPSVLRETIVTPGIQANQHLQEIIEHN